LHQEVSQSLAGRTALLTLFPLSLVELQASGHEPDPFETIVSGCFPRLHAEGLDPIRFFRGYCQTYLERDVRQLINLRDLTAFQSFLRLLAGRVGQIVNYSSLANDVGVSAVTIRQWIAVLQASHLVFVLPPYFENFSKRVIRSPKVYFTDPGVAAYLLGLTTAEQVRRDPSRGGLFENLVILEVWKTMVNRGREPALYFFRDSNGNEVDLLLREGRELVPVEVKSAETFTTEFLKGIARFRRVSGTEGPGFVVYAGTMEQDLGDTRLLAVGHAASISSACTTARSAAGR
jgi:predicted AAA+ superfamily ATPase